MSPNKKLLALLFAVMMTASLLTPRPAHAGIVDVIEGYLIGKALDLLDRLLTDLGRDGTYDRDNIGSQGERDPGGGVP